MEHTSAEIQQVITLEMDTMVRGIIVAVDGVNRGTTHDIAAQRLAQMAEMLRVEVTMFLEVLRKD
jgi:hypothetical protein